MGYHHSLNVDMTHRLKAMCNTDAAAASAREIAAVLASTVTDHSGKLFSMVH